MSNAINDPKDLMLMALQQRIGEITSNYEMQIANLRASMTIMSQNLEELKSAVTEIKKADTTDD